jgi:hypothetical protein
VSAPVPDAARREPAWQRQARRQQLDPDARVSVRLDLLARGLPVVPVLVPDRPTVEKGDPA